MEECRDHGESTDWGRRCSDRAERGGRQETVIFGSEVGLLDPNTYLFHGAESGKCSNLPPFVREKVVQK